VGLSLGTIALGGVTFWHSDVDAPPDSAPTSEVRALGRSPIDSLPMAGAPWTAADASRAREQVRQLQQDQKLEEAAQVATRCFTALPQNAECHLMLASTHAQRRNNALAAFHYRAFLGFAPPDDTRRASVAATLSGMEFPAATPTEKPLGAELSLEELQRHTQELLQKGELRSALKLAHQCDSRFPQDPDCQLQLAMLYTRLNDNRASIAHYQRFMDRAPATHPNRETVVKILDDANALSSASVRIARPETFADMMEVGRTAYRDEKYAEAATVLQNALTLKPRAIEARLELGLTLIKLKPGTPANYRQAVRHLEAVVDKDDGIRRAWQGLWEAHTLLGNKSRAKQAHERYMRMSPFKALEGNKRAQQLLKGY
jgi:eukaryotic-like serine/threonine-protein kinase